jgi:hypothetical protein
MLSFSGSPLRAHKAELIWISMSGNPYRSAWRSDVKGVSCNKRWAAINTNPREG